VIANAFILVKVSSPVLVPEDVHKGYRVYKA
jgi:hypothetical protein